jgi:hypothetical protein
MTKQSNTQTVQDLQSLKALYQQMQASSYTQAMRQAIKDQDLNRLDELALELLQDYPDPPLMLPKQSPQNAFSNTTEPVLNNSRCWYKCAIQLRK